MSSPADRLYNLLPAIYRIRDAAEDEPLRALLAIIEQELGTVEENINDLYENWFIETCEEWVVPYIGDLLDVRDLYAAASRTYGQQERRAYVANTLAYRRRKGTTPVLEQLVRDVTGWRSRAVEFFQLLSTSQQLNHARSANTSVNLHAASLPDLVGTPFEQRVAYTAEVRRIGSGGRQDLRPGRYGTASVGLFVWRLQSYLIERGTARAALNLPKPMSGRCYTFSPLG
ncbi:MAG TPA: phage tail protein, partial [Coleofasciculaceae cyanobacterium]